MNGLSEVYDTCASRIGGFMVIEIVNVLDLFHSDRLCMDILPSA